MFLAAIRSIIAVPTAEMKHAAYSSKKRVNVKACILTVSHS